MHVGSLKFFVVVAEEMSFHRAAERLGVSQPAVSKKISLLEQDLGLDLFIRDRRGIEALTPAGRAYLDECINLIAEIDRIKLSLPASSAGKKTLLRLGICEAVSSVVLLGILRKLRESLPDVVITFREVLPSEIAQAILRNKIDLGFGFFDADEKRLSKEWLWAEALMVAAPVGTLGEDGDLAPGVARPDFYMGATGTDPHAHDAIATSVLQAFNPAPRIIALAQISTALTLVSAGLGMTLLPASFKQLGLAGIEMVSLPRAQIEVGILYRQEDDGPSLLAALEIIRREAKILAASHSAGTALSLPADLPPDTLQKS